MQLSTLETKIFGCSVQCFIQTGLSCIFLIIIFTKNLSPSGFSELHPKPSGWVRCHCLRDYLLRAHPRGSSPQVQRLPCELPSTGIRIEPILSTWGLGAPRVYGGYSAALYRSSSDPLAESEYFLHLLVRLMGCVLLLLAEDGDTDGWR